MNKVIFLLTLFGFFVTAPAAEKKQFSSTYTDLSKDCKWAYKKSELGEGQDNSLTCKGYGGFKLLIYFSESESFLTVQRVNSNYSFLSPITIPSYKKGMIEWRMAGGHPFAIIVLSKVQDGIGEQKNSGVLKVQGLIGYEGINYTVSTKTNPRANKEARTLADNAYILTPNHPPRE